MFLIESMRRRFNMNEERRKGHAFVVRDRAAMEITGVTEVISFDEKLILLSTEKGDLSVEGEDLRVGTLDVERGEVRLTGKIIGVNYYESQTKEPGKKGFLGKLFR